jgi:formylglycine-generating enzyme required for sulfatase activity
VPGGTFNRYIEDDLEIPYPATVSPFYLDKFEVTVGRMRQFVSVYEQFKPTLQPGVGRSEHIDDDTGWRSTFDLPADKAALVELLKGEASDVTPCEQPTWLDTVGQNNDLPINCVTFNVAYAFCIWDGGGRLPTEAEWEFAAAGGEAQRTYPWKAADSGQPITSEYATYNSPSAVAVGITPRGDARWGQSDMAGNVAEWVLDYASGGYPETCQDCVNGVTASLRGFRGGGYPLDESSATASVRDFLDPTDIRKFLGFRCARDIE